MQSITSVILAFLFGFTFQSFTILLFRRSIFMRIVPLTMFIVPFSGIWEVVSHFPYMFVQTLILWLDILIPLLLGDILGWIIGFRFKKVFDEEDERNNEKTD